MSFNLNELEYEEQLYGFNRHTVVDFVKDVIMDVLEQGLESIHRKLIPKYGEGPTREFVPTFLEAYRTALLHRSGELAKIVHDFFAIDPNIVLPDDQIHDELRDDEEAHLDRQIEAEKRRYMALCVMERNMRNILQEVMRDDDAIAKLSDLSSTAGNLLQDTEALVSSLNNLDLSSIFSNMRLNGV